MPEKLPEYVWLYDNGKGHRWWSDVPNPENKDEAVKALISTPLLEHAGVAIELLKQWFKAWEGTKLNGDTIADTGELLALIEKEEKALEKALGGNK